MDAATTTLGGFVSLLGMSFANDMHIMECEQFLFFISISLSVSQKAADHFNIKIPFWTGIVFENSGKLWTEHLLLTYEKFSKLTQNPLESSAKILKAFTRCSRKVETDNDQRIKDVSTEIYHAYVALCYFTPLFGAIIVRDFQSQIPKPN